MISSLRFGVVLLCAVGAGACGNSHGTATDATSGGSDAPGRDATQGGDGNTGDAHADAHADATPDAAATFGLTAIFPTAASRTVDTALALTGFGINGSPAIHLANCDQPGTTYDLTPTSVTATSIATTIAADPARVQGTYTVTVTNGDGMVASLTCALAIVAESPPTVTVVVPTTAWHGAPNDQINSDVTVSIQGTGFLSTPNVTWVANANPAVHFDALFVGFVSDTQLSAVVPSETLSMPAGTYSVVVTNPDNLTGEWLENATPGVFTITDTPPPTITDVNPARIQNGGSCVSTEMTVTGTAFGAGATAWLVVPAGTTCAGSITDANGFLLCPLVVDSVAATTITTHLAACPAIGPYPLEVINPDSQGAYYYDVEITPSSDGHLNTGPFETVGNRLETARWKHAAQFGFDAFSNTFMYVAGGQDAAGNVLGSVEASQFDLFGTPGPFHHVEQYGGPATPRVTNDLTVPRVGSTLVRVGKTLFSIGGAAARTDTTTPIAAATTVERAEILGYAQMPGISRPTPEPIGSLPVGSWYYRVSAIGPWGESLATREVVALHAGGTIRVCWVAPQAPGAVSYNLYRSLASDGRAGTSAALAFEVGSTCFDDDGAGANTPGPANTRGTLAPGGTLPVGTYTYRVSAVVNGFETYAGYASATGLTATDVTSGNQTVALAWGAVAGANVTYRVFRLDPTTNTFVLLAGASALTMTSFTDGGVAFDASGATPRTEVRPLPSGSLSTWAATAPQLGAAREGLDGVVVTMDPATSNNLVARILVAGGRDGTGGAYKYRTTAESLGIFADGTTETAWTAETPVFAHPRAYYALLTTQDRNTTAFPPPADVPPCGDCTIVINIVQRTLGAAWSTTSASPPPAPPVVASAEPVYIVAVMGDDAFAASNNQGRSDFEACQVDAATGHLACGTTWTVQSQTDPHATFGQDAVLYFSFLYPFYGVDKETLAAPGTAISFVLAAIGRFPLLDLTAITGGQVFSNRQSASTAFNVPRAYYQMSRLLAYVYVIGGFAAAHTEGSVAVPAGPTGLVERHQQ